MKDIHRVYCIWLIATIPFIAALFQVAAVTTIVIAVAPVTPEHFLMLFLTAIFGYFIFLKSPRLRHYNKVFAEHEENYRYVEKAIAIDELEM